MEDHAESDTANNVLYKRCAAMQPFSDINKDTIHIIISFDTRPSSAPWVSSVGDIITAKRDTDSHNPVHHQ